MRTFRCTISRAIVGLLVLFAPALGASAACLSGGDSDTIMNSLQQNGVAELCQGAFFTADKIIDLKDYDQIYTTGYPTDISKKALIWVPDGVSYTTSVIQAHGHDGVQLRNFRINGNRAGNSYESSRALIAISGVNSVVDSVVASNTSGVSAIAAASDPNCSGLQITNNLIADNGIHPSTSPPGPYANGIDIRCSNALVSGNEIRNATDGAISFYGGSNTVIENNWVANNERSLFSGIIAANLYGEDFVGSVVRNNLIQTCCGQHIHVALAIGTHLWCDDAQQNGDCQISSGVTFRDNTGSGVFGYGIHIDGMLSATVHGNDLTMTEWPNIECYEAGRNWYVVYTPHASGSFQSGWVERYLHWPCLGPINKSRSTAKPLTAHITDAAGDQPSVRLLDESEIEDVQLELKKKWQPSRWLEDPSLGKRDLEK